MKKIILLALLSVLIMRTAQAQELKPFNDGDRVAFLGNSITEAGFYESYIWLYYMTRFPDMKIRIMNGGIGGDVVGQMNARFEDDILAMNPNIVVLTFGMNDSGYFEFFKDDAEKTAAQRVAKSQHDFELLQKKFKQHPEITPVIMSSSPYDETARMEGNNYTGKSKALEKIVAFQEKDAKKNKWVYVDLYHPMNEITQREQKTDTAYTITGPDRIHPGKGGHLVMAALFLKNQGLAGKPVADVSIDAKNALIEKSNNADVYLLDTSNDKVAFQYEAMALPFPVDSTASTWGNPQQQGEALKVYPFTKEFNQEILKVTNLNPGKYKLLIDGGEIAQFTADDLAKGVNMTEYNTPQYKQAKNVMFLNEQYAEIEGKLRHYNWVNSNFLRDKGMLYEDSQRAYDMASSKDDIFLGSKMGVYRTARFPEIRAMWQDNMDLILDKIYELNKPVAHKIEIIKI